MTRDEFDAAVAQTRLRSLAIQGAALVLLDGLTPAKAGEQMGRSREWARAAAKKVERVHLSQMGCPRGWELVSVPLPPDEAWQVREQSRELLQAHLHQQG